MDITDKINRILEKLSSRIDSSEEYNNPIINYCKELKKNRSITENDQKKIDGINLFIEEKINYEELLNTLEEKNDVNQNFISDKAKALNKGIIIPVLGTDIPSLPIKNLLANEAKYKDFNAPLPMISQYCHYTLGRRTILDTIKEALNPVIQSQLNKEYQKSIYHLLSIVQEPIIIISTSYENILEQVFIQNKKRFVVLSYNFRRNNFLLSYSDDINSQKKFNNKELSDLELLDKGYSIIYNICGSFDLTDDQLLDILMISEEDFFAFAGNLERMIPDFLEREFRFRQLLFLGYNLEEWQNSLIANALLVKMKSFNEKHYTVCENPSLYAKEYWNNSKVDVIKESLERFIDKLGDNLNTIVDNNIRKELNSYRGSEVFLCHNNKDKSEVIQIAEQLIKCGIKPWIDERDIIPGEEWQEKIVQQLKKCNTVAIFLGETVGPRQNKEISISLEHNAQKGTTIIPIFLKNCSKSFELPDLLKKFHCVDFRKNNLDQLQQLISGIRKNNQ